jgi:hypothetical protein
MKNIIFIIIIPLFFISCDKAEIIIIFDNDVNLPSSIFDFNSSETIEFQKLGLKYDSLKSNNFILKKKGIPGSFDKTIPNPALFKAGLTDVIGGALKVRPVFDLQEINIFYRKIALAFGVSSTRVCSTMVTTKGRSTIPNLQNIVTLGCLPISDCDVIKTYLNSLGLGNICTVVCSNDIISPNPDRLIPISSPLSCTTTTQYRNLMNIDNLNNTPYDSIDGTHFSGINGRNANLIVVENSQPVDWLHYKFTDILRFRGREENLGFGSSMEHSTSTFGVLFAKDDTTFDCCVGVSREANLRKIVYTFIEGCGKTDAKATSHGALLKAINKSAQGDIMLLEYSLGSLPLELDLIDAKLILACTNILGVTVIEPIGNQDRGQNITSLKPYGFVYEGILVSSATTPTGSSVRYYVKSPEANYSNNNTDIDCFGLDEILTTNPRNSYAKYGLTSAAAAQIAGLALDIQGYCFSKTGCYLTPQEMKYLFRNTPSSLQVMYLKPPSAPRTSSSFTFNQVIPDAMNLKGAVDAKISSSVAL